MLQVLFLVRSALGRDHLSVTVGWAFSTPQNTGGLLVPQSPHCPHCPPGPHCTETRALLAGVGGSWAGVHLCVALNLFSRLSCLGPGRQPQPWRVPLESRALDGLAIHIPNFLNTQLPGSKLENRLCDLQYLIAC